VQIGVVGIDHVRKWVSEYVAKPKLLLLVMRDSSVPKRVAAAAAMMYLLHPDSEINVVPECENRLEELYERDAEPWYLKGAGVALHQGIAADRSTALDAMDGLLQRAQTDFKNRRGLDQVLRNWRELSRSPVQSCCIEGLWN
jgi:hypothetical protein